MELQKMKILTATMALMSMWMVSVEGGYVEAGNYFEASPASPPFLHSYDRYGYQFPVSSPVQFNQHPQQKGVPAVIPVSPVFDIEVMKPMAQLEEKKEVTLYIVPQSALHVYPHVQHKVPVRIRLPPVFNKYRGTLPLTSALSTSPGHIPAVEIPLERPMVIGSSESQVIAPAGFTVLLNGPHGARLNYPIVTGALLAPVPVGTVISPDTPVVLTTLYAVPNLPSMPSAIKILAQFTAKQNHHPNKAVVPASPVPVSSVIPLGSPAPYPFSPVPVSAVHDFSGQNYYPVSPIKQQVSVYPSADYGVYPYPGSPHTIVQRPQNENKNYGDGQLINVTPASVVSVSGPGGYPSSTFAPQIPQEQQPPQQQRPFLINSKESPYLNQLREDSLKRQIQDLQKQLEQLQSGPFQI